MCSVNRYGPAGVEPATKEETMRRATVAAVLALAMGFTAGPGEAQTVSGYQTIAAQARWEANHGGILGADVWQATPRLQSLSRQLVTMRFSSAGSEAVAWALCVVRHESGFNPGAVNRRSGATGLFQFHGHPQFSDWRLKHDPGYAVDAAWSLSHGARDKSPWNGGGYSCP